VDPKGIEPSNLTDANRALSQRGKKMAHPKESKKPSDCSMCGVFTLSSTTAKNNELMLDYDYNIIFGTKATTLRTIRPAKLPTVTTLRTVRPAKLPTGKVITMSENV